LEFRSNEGGSPIFSNPAREKSAWATKVIVGNVEGVEYGEIVLANRDVEDDKIVQPLKKILRKATQKDAEHLLHNKAKEREAYKICLKKIDHYKLEMKLIDVEYTFDNNKILFYFTADGRVDFRELVKDLASVFKTRIELRQIGVRDEAKMIGGLGVCGRRFAARAFPREFQPCSIRWRKSRTFP
jgi:cell fate regulator YaaT (PSP1 superfamily)